MFTISLLCFMQWFFYSIKIDFIIIENINIDLIVLTSIKYLKYLYEIPTNYYYLL